MSERKVLNKYYPPEFDPSKIPRLKVKRTGVFSIRIMAPFNMRCNTCGEYIYKGKKFNSRKENVDDDDYLGLRIFRFYIKCPRCVAEIAFKTDIANTDYACEAGATRLFEAEKLARSMAEKEMAEKEADELNPMKVLENRTKASRNEMDQLDQLEELREMNARHAKVSQEEMLKEHMVYEDHLLKLQEEEEDRMVQSILNKGKSGEMMRRIDDSKPENRDWTAKRPKLDTSGAPTDILAEGSTSQTDDKPKKAWEKSVGSFSSKLSLASLVKRKTPSKPGDAAPGPPSHQQQGSSSSSTTITTTSNTALKASSSSSSSQPSSSSSGPAKPALGALSMLGGYSDSDSTDSN